MFNIGTCETAGMKWKVKVVPNARKPRVIQEGDLVKVYVQAPPVDNKANDAVIKALADYFKVRRSAVVIIAGHRSRLKTVRVEKS